METGLLWKEGTIGGLTITIKKETKVDTPPWGNGRDYYYHQSTGRCQGVEFYSTPHLITLINLGKRQMNLGEKKKDYYKWKLIFTLIAENSGAWHSAMDLENVYVYY